MKTEVDQLQLNASRSALRRDSSHEASALSSFGPLLTDTSHRSEAACRPGTIVVVVVVVSVGNSKGQQVASNIASRTSSNSLSYS